MNKFFTTFLAVTASGATMIALAIVIISPLRANAYALGGSSAPLPVLNSDISSGSASGTIGSYDFGSSFRNLVSPFTNFFNSMQSSGGTSGSGVVSVSAGSAAPGVTIRVDTQPYINQFDAWFYNATGVHIEGFVNFVMNFFGWFFGVLGGIIIWIAGLFKGGIH
jgi:hypothetical protein